MELSGLASQARVTLLCPRAETASAKTISAAPSPPHTAEEFGQLAGGVADTAAL